MRYNKLKIENPASLPAVSIDEAAETLQVERRRIYDIINILEAIRVVSRKCKNTYNWHGMDDIMETFGELQKESFVLFPEDAKRNGLIPLNGNGSGENGATASAQAPAPVPVVMEPKPKPPTGLELLLASAEQVEVEQKNNPKSKSTFSSSSSSSKPKKKPASKEKSLGRLSQKFIQLFLAGNETIALNDASDKILGKIVVPDLPDGASASDILKARNKANKMLKTKIRRLYDIANVMASIGLITKLNGGNNLNNAARNRPSFKWIYPVTAKELLEKSNASNAGVRSGGTVVSASVNANATITASHQVKSMEGSGVDRNPSTASRGEPGFFN